MRVIPKIKEIIFKNDIFLINNLKNIYFDENFYDSKKFILSIFQILDTSIKINKKESSQVHFIFNEKLQDEEYKIDINKNFILIESKTNNGAIYAAQTLRQLGEFDLNKINIKCAIINDLPEYNMRSLMLDESRHFFGKETVKSLFDMMSFMKLNTFHWHLTDSEGWRIEIKKYPKLTEIGSYRKKTQIGGYKILEFDNKPHFGYYTQEDIKELVKYAKERGINIIPEIDMPGHFSAAAAAYPELTCNNIKRDVPFYFSGYYPKINKIEHWDRPLCIANVNSIEFAKNIIDEVISLFPYPYFHIGGDEVSVSEWKTCPKCQNLIKEKNLKNERALQTYFTNIIKEHLEKKKIKLIGWNEILWGDNIDINVIPEYWTYKTDKKVIQFLKNGGNIIISKHNYFYFDMPYSQNPLNKTYSFNLNKLKIDNKYKKQIKGIEGTLWTEWIDTKEKFDFMLYPRLQTLSEVSWNDTYKNKKEFFNSLRNFNEILMKYKINFAKESIASPKGIIKKIYTVKKWRNNHKDIEQNLNKK